jgi:sulfoxide reductase catalytic subunit YedY
MANDTIRTRLPLHRPPAGQIWPGRVRVDGLVRRPRDLTLADLMSLPQRTVSDDFTCLEGWTVPALSWRGVPLAAVLDLVGVDPAARWLQASAADFSAPLPLDAVGDALLALRLGDAELPADHGGPVRLVVPRRECYTSIKWLDRLELRRQPAPNVARAKALARLP